MSIQEALAVGILREFNQRLNLTNSDKDSSFNDKSQTENNIPKP